MASGYVGVLTCELHFPSANSLKEKRHYLRSAKAQLQNRVGASVAEVDHHDVWQRARITVACVAREHREAERLLDEAERWLRGQEWEVALAERFLVDPDDGETGVVAAVRDDVPDGRNAVAVRSLREALERAEFTVDAVEERLGTHELSARPADTAVHRHRLTDADAFSTFARLFLLGDEVDGGRLASAVAPGSVEQLAALHVVASASGVVRPLVRLVPHGEYFIASDAGPEAGADVPFEHVPGIQSPSVTLAKLAVRRPCRAALDLGTGCGIQALLASKHAERVVATDINSRALAFAAFNAALNSIDTIEFRPGERVDPVGEERFDLIVANPRT